MVRRLGALLAEARNAAREVAERSATLAKLEFELARIEMRRKLAAFALGAALAGAALLLGLIGLVFALAAAAAALALALPLWLAVLTVALATLALALVLGGSGVVLLRRAGPPLPTEAISQAEATRAAISR